MKAIETEYKGYRFRSRLEARWAVFFDACGVKWEYEPEGFDLGDGLYYLPDFLLHDVWIRNSIKHDLWVEVKGVMNEVDKFKIFKFACANGCDGYIHVNSIIVLANIPEGDNVFDFFDYIISNYDSGDGFMPTPFHFGEIDCDNYHALPCISPEGHFAIEGGDYTEDIDNEATEKAYRLARQARFEHR